MPAIPIGTRVRVKGKPPSRAFKREYEQQCDRHPDQPRYPGSIGQVTAHITARDPWPVGQLPGDPLHSVEFSGGKSDGYWYEELEVLE